MSHLAASAAMCDQLRWVTGMRETALGRSRSAKADEAADSETMRREVVGRISQVGFE